MADIETVRYWRTRSYWCAFGFVVSLAVSGILTMTNSASITAGLSFLALAVLFFLVGLFCTNTQWQAFRNDEIANGGSKQAALEKWRKMYPIE